MFYENSLQAMAPPGTYSIYLLQISSTLYDAYWTLNFSCHFKQSPTGTLVLICCHRRTFQSYSKPSEEGVKKSTRNWGNWKATISCISSYHKINNNIDYSTLIIINFVFFADSLCNIEEVQEVVQFIKKLLSKKLANGRTVTETDIGVVTPYKLQCRRIGQACRANRIHDVTIGTAEKFQGQEKPIMIVSTVRAGGYCSTFVNDPRVTRIPFCKRFFFHRDFLPYGFKYCFFFISSQRLNVIITRAKCLLIILGDPKTLSTVTYWSRLIRYCVMNNALIESGRFIGWT